jgi:hypothetical protein
VGKDNAVYFLLAFSFDEGRLIREQQFDDREEAVAAYNDAENSYRGQLDKYEVVLIGADSIATVMKTHGHYFRQSDNSLFSEFLADA